LEKSLDKFNEKEIKFYEDKILFSPFLLLNHDITPLRGLRKKDALRRLETCEYITVNFNAIQKVEVVKGSGQTPQPTSYWIHLRGNTIVKVIKSYIGQDRNQFKRLLMPFGLKNNGAN